MDVDLSQLPGIELKDGDVVRIEYGLGKSIGVFINGEPQGAFMLTDTGWVRGFWGDHPPSDDDWTERDRQL